MNGFAASSAGQTLPDAALVARSGPAARLSFRVGRVPRARGSPFLVAGTVPAGQPRARACRRVIGALI
jgi:hypothetical protein